MKLAFCDGDDGKKKLYIYVRADNGTDYFLYEKNYIQQPQSEWKPFHSDSRDSIALIAELDDTYEYDLFSEAKLYHCVGFCKQIQKELESFLSSGSKKLPQTLQEYGLCRNEISNLVDAARRHDAARPDLDDSIDYIFFEDDWKNVYGTDLTPPKSKGDEGIEK